MQILIVYAHPEPASFNGAMKDRAVAVLTEAGHDVRVSDLCAMGWSAAVLPSDFTARLDPAVLHVQAEQAHAAQTGTFSADVAAEMANLHWADLAIFQFPIWWWSMPGILKGYVDRVFAYGFAYGRDGHALVGKKGMCCVTTGGPAASYAPDNRGTLLELLRPIHQGVFAFCGMQALPPFAAYGPARITDEERSELLDRFDAYLRQVDALPPLVFDRG